jgi:fatty acid desaturase/predicted heme/steroid binding protein
VTATTPVTLEELARHDGRDGTYWMEVQGEVYDVTAFVPKHPGRGLLKLGAGRQATTLFESYHPGRSLDHARRALTAMAKKGQRVGTLEPSAREVYGDPAFFDSLRGKVDDELKARGLNYHSGGRLLAFEYAILVALFLGAWALRTWSGSLAYSYLAAIVGGLVVARLGFAMHTGNHAAVGKRGFGSLVAGSLMDLVGGSSLVWRASHQVSHHGKPNIRGADNDAEIGYPFLRFHPELPRKPAHRLQTVTLGVGMSIGLIKWIISDVIHAKRGKVTHAAFHVSRGEWAKLIVFKSLWVAMHVVVPVIVLGPLHGILTMMVMMAIGAYYMEGIFIVNHLQKGLVPRAGAHWAEQQVQGSANWSSGSRWANWLSGGLNHQIEHHLFPSVSIYLYPVISPIVRRTCAEHGLEYRDYQGFFPALSACAGYLHDLGKPDPAGAVIDAEPAT